MSKIHDPVDPEGKMAEGKMAEGKMAEGTTPEGTAPEGKEVKVKVEVRSYDMSPELLKLATALAREAVTRFETEVEVAGHLKAEMDRRIGPKWHCAVGRHFASHVNYMPGNYVNFKVGREAILLFKSGGSGGVTLLRPEVLSQQTQSPT